MDHQALTEAYLSGESASSIARRLGCSTWNVLNRLKKTGVLVRSSKEQNARYLGDREHRADWDLVSQVLEGVLLGDGSLDPKGSLRLEQGRVRLGWLDSLTVLLVEHGCESAIIPVPPRSKCLGDRVIHGRGGRLLYTPCYSEFKTQRARWYPRGVKIVPSDLVLTPLSVAQWFAGDGTYDRQGQLFFCTDGFSEGCVSRLSEKLGSLGVRTVVRESSVRPGQFKIAVNTKAEAVKLKSLVENHLPACCLYKLRFVREPNWKPSRKLSDDQVLEARGLFAEGWTKASLARKFGITDSAMGRIISRRSYKDLEG